jgi:hypothetical protein
MTIGNQLFTNNAISLLAEPITTDSTTISLQTGLGALYPQPINSNDWFAVTVETISAPIIREIIYITGRSGDVLTIGSRGQEGTSIQDWAANICIVDHRVTAITYQTFISSPNPSGNQANVTSNTILDSVVAFSAKYLVYVQSVSTVADSFSYEIHIGQNGVETNLVMYSTISFGEPTITGLTFTATLTSGNTLVLSCSSSIPVNVSWSRIGFC